jgi:hypothetical protein
MRTSVLTILSFILTLSLTFAQTDCQKANERAKLDFKNSNYSFHSKEILPVENTYFYVLGKYYNINWYFTDSLDYYNCYDSVMRELLMGKFGLNFLDRARSITDSLDNSLNWRKETQFPGGQKELFKFISSRLMRESIKVDSVRTKTRLFVQFEIDSVGKVSNPKVRRGINRKIDRTVIDVIKQLPNFEPAYLYGKPIKQSYTMPINIELE